MGKAYPGHRVGIMGPTGKLLPDGEEGEIVAHKDDPVHFLGYWKNSLATASKYTGDWFHLGDVGYRDEAGYLWFLGRADDVISSAGYRIGPGEIEDCVLKHAAVQQVAAIGVPDPDGIRGDVVKLCIVLNEDETPSDKLEEEIRRQVRTQLAAYEYPRQIEFMESLPMTTTGKIKRIDLRRMHIEQMD
jgi:acetyl-CoA synthetase